MYIRIGQGLDTHQLQLNTPLILGGVTIPYEKGSKGHSDGDVLYHAIVDAIFGAMSLGDIGTHFPSHEQKWKNADSSHFLKHAFDLIVRKKLHIINLDSTILLQEPHISKYIPEMKNNISKILKMEISNISVKATTTDHLGFIGNSKGITAHAIVLIGKLDERKG